MAQSRSNPSTGQQRQEDWELKDRGGWTPPSNLLQNCQEGPAAVSADAAVSWYCIEEATQCGQHSGTLVKFHLQHLVGKPQQPRTDPRLSPHSLTDCSRS